MEGRAWLGVPGSIWVVIFHPWGEQWRVLPCAGEVEAQVVVGVNKLRRRYTLIVRVKS